MYIDWKSNSRTQISTEKLEGGMCNTPQCGHVPLHTVNGKEGVLSHQQEFESDHREDNHHHPNIAERAQHITYRHELKIVNVQINVPTISNTDEENDKLDNDIGDILDNTGHCTVVVVISKLN